MDVHGLPDAVTGASPALLEGQAHVRTMWVFFRCTATQQVLVGPETLRFQQLPGGVEAAGLWPRPTSVGLESLRVMEVVGGIIRQLK